MKRYFLGLSSQYSTLDTFRHTFASGNEYHLSELRAFLAAHYGATFDHVAVYANGRSALNAAVKAVAERGSKVVITSLTCYAVVQAVKAAGCTPIFADVDKKTLHFGKAELEKALEGETNVRAVIVQNNLGIPADIVGIEEVAKAHKLSIIEDLAHCAGVRYADGREAGTVGRVAALSFGKGKSIDTITGGAVVFTNPLDTPVEQPDKAPLFGDNFRARFYPLFSLLIRGCYYIHPKVGKYLTAALLRFHAIKRSADGDIDLKTRLSFWQCQLAVRQLKALPHRGRPPLRDFYLVENRDLLLKELAEIGYYFHDIWYDLPVAPERYFNKADFHAAECPVAAKLAEQIVNVPTNYDAAELKPALRLIKKYLYEKEEPKDDDALEIEEPLTEAEKKAKIRAEKAARKKAKRSAHKTKKPATEPAESAKSAESEPTEEDKDNSLSPKRSSRPSSRGSSPVLVVTADVGEKELSSSSTVVEASRRGDGETSRRGDAPWGPPNESAPLGDAKLGEDGAAGPRSARPQAEERFGENTLASAFVKAKPSVETKPETKPQAKGNAIMRQAPRKLSAREKLKLELESGKKEGPSVI